jgi:F-type H+-transporting ATPase subunit b
MALITPGIGLLFWMLVSFSIVLFILKKYAWKPILSSLKEREYSIAESLNKADEARKAMAALQSDNERILKEAREERDVILKQGREIKDKMVADAKGQAQSEANKIVTSARENIETEKLAAIAEIKNHVASLSIDIAEKILKNELEDASKQKRLVDNLLEDIKLN